MSPFGPKKSGSLEYMDTTEGLRSIASHTKVNDLDASIDDRVSIEIYPKSQRFHDAQHFKIIVKDTAGIEPNHRLRVFYNDEDVTEAFLGFATKTIDQEQGLIEFSFPHLRLPAGKRHDILVSYERKTSLNASLEGLQNEEIFLQKFNPPTCQYRSKSPLHRPEKLRKHHGLIRKIENLSLSEGVNPSFYAALIAQESSFNPQAVSHAKAIGLSQVTDLAQQQIFEKELELNWPMFEAIREMSAASVKASILLGKINSKNEWRLNTEKSLMGGISYLQYLEEYWTLPSHWKQLEKTFGPINHNSEVVAEILLASYNSGPFRVKRALINDGTNWLSSPGLNEARKYVQRIQSYCDQFHTGI